MKRLLLTVLFSSTCCFAAPQPLEDGPIHDAFVAPIGGQRVYQPTPQPPPPRLDERKPTKPEGDYEWIPGYWNWNGLDFVWVSGTWRKPPPGMEWVSGEWAHLDEGYVWLRGFWHDPKAGDLKYRPERPPGPVRELMGDPPGDNYFWKEGHWEWNGEEYEWKEGSWKEIEPGRVYVLAHYEWRPEGYVLIEGYWDWPVDQVGRVYANVAVPPEDREEPYTPSVVVPPERVAKRIASEYSRDPRYERYFYYHRGPHFLEPRGSERNPPGDG